MIESVDIVRLVDAILNDEKFVIAILPFESVSEYFWESL